MVLNVRTTRGQPQFQLNRSSYKLKSGCPVIEIPEQRWYIGNVVMSQSSKTSGTNFEVLHGDAQGSTVTVTDGSGKLVSHSLYDAWGQQSVLQVGPPSQLFIQSLQRRGYTGHENVEGLGIIHMNGRIYDPLLARFVQADPTLQFAQLSQGYNRYSYVLNNPMTYTDPSGYFVKSIFKALAKVPLLDQIVTVAVSIFAVTTGNIWLIAAYQGLKTYALTGSLSTALRAAAITTLTSYITAGVSNYIGTHVTNLSLNVLAHSTVGGVMSVLQGGKFGHGFFSSMVSTSLKMFMEPQTGTFSDAVRRTMVASIVGGTVSALTGGKFANGAITSAIQWWMNAEGNPAARSAWNPKTRSWEVAPSSDMQPEINPVTGELVWIHSQAKADIAFRGKHVASLSSCAAFLDCVDILENGLDNYREGSEKTGLGQIPEVEIEIIKGHNKSWLNGRLTPTGNGGVKVTVPVVDGSIKIGIQYFCSYAAKDSC